MPGANDRLKRYGLSEQTVQLKNVTVESGGTMTLNSKSRAGQYKTIETKSFKTLKNWIGIEDKVVKENPQLMGRPSMKVKIPGNLMPLMRAPTTGRSVSLPERVLPTMKHQMKSLASQYLYGNSESVAVAESILERFWPKISIGIFLFYTIEVQSGAVLEVDSDVNVLWANKLIVHEGGLVRVHLGNSFKLDVDVLEKS